LRTSKVGDQRWTNGTTPLHGFQEHRRNDTATFGGESLEGVDRSEHLCEVTARGAEIELDVVALTDELVMADRETMTVDLKSVPQSRLHDPVAPVDLNDQPADIPERLGRNPGDVIGHHGTEEQTTEPWGRVDREYEMSERQASCRHGRSGMEDLEFSEQHGRAT